MKALSIKNKLIQKTRIVSLCVLALFFICIADSHARDWYVSQEGSGLKNGTSAENAWAGWKNIDWDTDGSGPDTGVGAGDTLYVIGTIRALDFQIKGSGLSEKKRLTLKSYPKNPGKLWQGLEITGKDWNGPDTYGAYSKTVHFPTDYLMAQEWTKDPWEKIDNNILETMKAPPDSTWKDKSGLYFCDSIFQKVYYKPKDGNPSDKILTAWSSTSRAIVLRQRKFVTISGLTINNQIKIHDGSDNAIIENCDIRSMAGIFGIQVGDYPGHTPSHHGIIRGNHIHDCGSGIYFINQGYGNQYNNDHWLVEYNYIENIHVPGASKPKDCHGIGIQGGTGNIFQFNHIFNAGSGITFWNHKYQIMRDNIVRFNKVHRMGYYGKFQGNGRGIEFSGETADSNLTTGNMIYGNIVSDCTGEGYPDGVGIRSKMGIPDSGYSLKILFNTVSDCATNYHIMPTNYENGEVGAYLHNNISHNPKGNGHHVFISPKGLKYNLSLDYNTYHGPGNFHHRGKNHKSLPEWKNHLNMKINKNHTNAPKLDSDFKPMSGFSEMHEGSDMSSLVKEGLHPDSVFPTGVNSGKIILIDMTKKDTRWHRGAYIYSK